MRALVTGGSGFIGTQLIADLLGRGFEVLNLDVVPPKMTMHSRHWVKADIMNSAELRAEFFRFQPAVVYNLAARTDTLSNKLADYKVNFAGAQNVYDCVAAARGVRLIQVSTQFVNQYAGAPTSDQDYHPHTTYGESKVLSEQLLHSCYGGVNWTIARPTNIWGPWHPRYPYEFWSILARGLYVHPGRDVVRRSYGYVRNVTHQLIELASSTSDDVLRRVFYVGDEPIDLYEWVNGFSLAQTGRPARVVPRVILRAIARVGDLVEFASSRHPPLTTSRFRSMTESNAAPMEATFKICGRSPVTLSQGIEETVDWMRVHHPGLVPVDL